MAFLRNAVRRASFLAVSSLALSAHSDELRSSPLAEAYGVSPLVRDVRLSPDGSRVSEVRSNDDGTTMLVVHDVAEHSTRVVAVGRLGFEIIERCGWAN